MLSRSRSSTPIRTQPPTPAPLLMSPSGGDRRIEWWKEHLRGGTPASSGKYRCCAQEMPGHGAAPGASSPVDEPISRTCAERMAEGARPKGEDNKRTKESATSERAHSASKKCPDTSAVPSSSAPVDERISRRLADRTTEGASQKGHEAQTTPTTKS